MGNNMARITAITIHWEEKSVP